MIMLIPLVAHVLMSLIMLALPYMTRREILFGVVVPEDFRSSPEGRGALHRFRWIVASVAGAGLIVIALLGSRSVSVFILAPMAVNLAGFLTFLLQNRRLKPFGVQPPAIRELQLGAASERLPWFTWLGLLPLLGLLAAGLYLNAHWDSIPARYPVHFDLSGNPNRWADRSFRGVYGPLVFGAELLMWLFGFALAIWYGTRRSEPLRKPAVGFLIAIQWAFGLTIAGVSLVPLMHLPVGAIALSGLPIILGAVIYLMKKSRDPSAPVDPTPNECWKGGIIYYNPGDAALFVARRDGIGFTSNMGNPWSWVMLGSLPVLIAVGFLIVL
jgi:uncharacterized membrane protein